MVAAPAFSGHLTCPCRLASLGMDFGCDISATMRSVVRIKCCNRCGIVQGILGHFGRVDRADLDEVRIFSSRGIAAEAVVAFRDPVQDHRRLDTRIC